MVLLFDKGFALSCRAGHQEYSVVLTKVFIHQLMFIFSFIQFAVTLVHDLQFISSILNGL